MIKAIIFDVGGTLLEGSCGDFIQRSAKILGIDPNKFHIDEVTFAPEYNKGKISADEFFKILFKMNIPDDKAGRIKNEWTSTWILTDEMAELIKKLKRNYVLAILSNSDQLNSENYARRGWYSLFDHLILSHEQGVIKPDPMIYNITLQKIGFPAENCLFIDDQEKALEPARKMGMKTILYKSLFQLKQQLRELSIKF